MERVESLDDFPPPKGYKHGARLKWLVKPATEASWIQLPTGAPKVLERRYPSKVTLPKPRQDRQRR